MSSTSTGGVIARMLGVTLRRRCPACGRGRIWDGWLRLRERCNACGFAPNRGEADYFIGAYLVNLVVAELVAAFVAAGVVIATWPDPPWTGVLWGAASAALLAPLLFYPFTVTLWLAVDVFFRPVRD